MKKVIIVAITLMMVVIMTVSAQKGRSFVNPAKSPARKALAKSPTKPLVPPPRISQTHIDSNLALSTGLRPNKPQAPAPAPPVSSVKLPSKAAVAAPVPRRPTPSQPALRPAPSPVVPSQAAVKPASSPFVPSQAPKPAPSRPSFDSSALAGPTRDRDYDEDGGPHPAPEPYSFSFAVNDDQSGAQLTREERQDQSGNVVGFYHIIDAEGRRRRVDYTAGPEGFKATISSNEEGLINRDSADAGFTVEEVSEDRQNAAAAAAQAAARDRPKA